VPERAVLQADALIQIGLAILLGGIIGLERELRGRAAGFRTMILVCLGSSLVMMVSSGMTGELGEGGGQLVRVDPGRIAAGIVTGIGFLGAGVVVKLGDVIRGVTTAATIWFVAGIGIAIGDRRYALAVTATLTALAVLVLLQFVEKRLKSHAYRVVTVTAAAERSASVLVEVRRLLDERRMRLMELKASEHVEQHQSTMVLHVRTEQLHQAHDVVRTIAGVDGVIRVEWN
jgi:putative Mg2+ transporter-C (MgtC) family protein